MWRKTQNKVDPKYQHQKLIRVVKKSCEFWPHCRTQIFPFEQRLKFSAVLRFCYYGFQSRNERVTCESLILKHGGPAGASRRSRANRTGSVRRRCSVWHAQPREAAFRCCAKSFRGRLFHFGSTGYVRMRSCGETGWPHPIFRLRSKAFV